MTRRCDARTEVYSRVCGFFRPVQQWNLGKKSEFQDRRTFRVREAEAAHPEPKRAAR